MCPPLVLGPIVHYLNSLDALNTSNQRTRDAMLGKWKEEVPPTGTFIWTDVRDLALAHVLAIEKEAAANKRFFITAGLYTNKGILEAVAKGQPEVMTKDTNTKPGDFPEEGIYNFDNSRSKEVLGLQYSPFEKAIVDTVKSLEAVGA